MFKYIELTTENGVSDYAVVPWVIRMGYAVIMFVMLLFISAVMVTAVNYGVMKENQIVPLKAKNDYAERETGKTQTGLTIANTCLDGESRYTKPSPGLGLELTLHLTLRTHVSNKDLSKIKSPLDTLLIK